MYKLHVLEVVLIFFNVFFPFSFSISILYMLYSENSSFPLMRPNTLFFFFT